MGLFRRSALPFEPKELLLSGERVLAWGLLSEETDGSTPVAVASDVALYIPSAQLRMPYELILKGQWDDPVLEITATPRGKEVPRRVTLTFSQPGLIPDVVYERVNATIVLQTHEDLVGDKGATFVARRTDGDVITWNVIFDVELDPRDEQLRELADARLVSLRESAGI